MSDKQRKLTAVTTSVYAARLAGATPADVGEAVAEAEAQADEELTSGVFLVFQPEGTQLRFVGAEDGKGNAVKGEWLIEKETALDLGEWLDRGDGSHVLHVATGEVAISSPAAPI